MSNTITQTPTVGSTYFGVTPPATSSGLNVNTFINLLVSELQNQDPTQPMSSSDMATQMSQLGQLQGISQLNTNSQMQEAQSLVGKTITSSHTDQTTGVVSQTNGLVTGASVVNGNYTLSVLASDGTTKTVSLGDVNTVQPNLDPTSAASLIGRTISGTATVPGSTQPQAITGTVTSINVSGGSTVLEVNTSNFGTVQVQTSNISSVS